MPVLLSDHFYFACTRQEGDWLCKEEVRVCPVCFEPSESLVVKCDCGYLARIKAPRRRGDQHHKPCKCM